MTHLRAQPPRGLELYDLARAQADLSDAELVARSRDGEPWSQTVLCQRYWRVVHAVAVRLAGHNDAEDVTQEAFAHAFSSLHDLRDPSAFRAWICCMGVRLSRRHYRRRALMRRFVETSVANTSLPNWDARGSAELALELRELSRGVAGLEASRRAALMLRLEGKTKGETAQALGVSLSSVKRWLTQVDRYLAGQGNLSASIGACL